MLKKKLPAIIIFVLFTGFLIIASSCSKQENLSNIPKETKLIVNIPDIMFKTPDAITELLGKESSKYPIKSYGDRKVIGEGRVYNKDGVVINVEISNNKVVFIWLELSKANITGTWQEALGRFGLYDENVKLIKSEFYRRDFSGKPYKVVLSENKTPNTYYDLTIGDTLDR